MLSDLGDTEDILKHWAFDADQLREFAGAGPMVRDATAFYLADGRETNTLTNLLQTAVAQNNL